MYDGTALFGGGLYAAVPGPLSITRSRIDGNHATGAGGGIDVGNERDREDLAQRRSTTTRSPTPAMPRTAPGSATTAESMTITDTEVTDNTATGADDEAAYGGGIYSSRRRTEADGPPQPDHGQRGRLPHQQHLRGRRAACSSTRAPSRARIVNSSIVDNNVGAPDGRGGGVYAQSGTVEIVNVTFALNTRADRGDSVFTFNTGANRAAQLDPARPRRVPRPLRRPGTITSAGYNVASRTTPTATSPPTTSPTPRATRASRFHRPTTVASPTRSRCDARARRWT